MSGIDYLGDIMGSRGKSKKPAEPKDYTEYNPEGKGIRGLRQTEYDDERKQRGLSDRRTILKKQGPGELVTTRKGHMQKKQYYKYKTEGGYSYKIDRKTGKRKYIGKQPDIKSIMGGLG